MQALIREINKEHMQSGYEYGMSEKQFRERYKEYLRNGGIIGEDLLNALETHFISMIHSQAAKDSILMPVDSDMCAEWILDQYYELDLSRESLFSGMDKSGGKLNSLIFAINRGIKEHNETVERDLDRQRELGDRSEHTKSVLEAQKNRAMAYPDEEQHISATKKQLIEIDIDM